MWLPIIWNLTKLNVTKKNGELYIYQNSLRALNIPDTTEISEYTYRAPKRLQLVKKKLA